MNLRNKFLKGDVMKTLAKIPNDSIDAVVTSIPFYQVRDYNESRQWGHEKTLHEYITKIMGVLGELSRVITEQGIIWMEIGDKRENNSWLMIPEEIATKANAEGFYIVNKPIWYKTNAMPLSSKNLLSPKYTNWYGFAISSKYFFNLEDVRVPPLTKSKPFNVRVRDSNKSKFLRGTTDEERIRHNKKGELKQDNTSGPDGKPLGHYKGFNKRYSHAKIEQQGKNPGDIITQAVRPMLGLEHYATFPLEIGEFFVRCSTRKGDLVLDPFMGSGTVAEACIKSGRDYLGIDLSQKYIDFAKNRVKIARGKYKSNS